MKKVSITGGIGSGKTTVCEIFKVLGISVFQADKARLLQESDNQIRSKLIDLFGSSIYSEDGKLDRKKMAGLIFKDQELIKKVNQIIHPAVRETFISWLAGHKEEKDYILYEAAIIFETGYYKEFDYNILVVADEDTRIKRVMKRDKISRDAVMERIRNQMSDELKIPMADFIIENNGQNMVIPQVLKINNFLKSNGEIW